MSLGGTNGADDALANTGKDGVFACATHQLLYVSPHGDTSLGDELNTILSHGCHRRRVDYLGIDTRLDCLKDIAACKVDGGSLFKAEFDISLAG